MYNNRARAGAVTFDVSSSVSGSTSLTLYASFKKQPNSFFEVGKVVGAVLHERAGATSRKDARFLSPDPFNRPTLSKPRMYIIVEVRDNRSQIIPITSYGDQGVSKRSVVASEHAIVFSILANASHLPQERARAQDMFHEPIRIEMATGKAPITKGSRADFGNVQTLQHYDEVEDVGMVARDCIDALLSHYNTVRLRSTGSLASVAPALDASLSREPTVVPPIHRDDSGNVSGCIGQSYYLVPEEKLGASLTAPEDIPARGIYKYISNDCGEEEERDTSYRIQVAGTYTFGTVIRLLSWNEEPTGTESAITERVVNTTSDGTPILREILWLVVISEGIDSFNCLRLTTHEGRGVSDLPKGLLPSHHSIIHTGHTPPELSLAERPSSADERPLGLPIRVRQANREEKLSPLARLLWTRVYNVKTDVKANIFGHVAHRCEHILETQFKQLNPTSLVKVIQPSRVRQIDGGRHDPWSGARIPEQYTAAEDNRTESALQHSSESEERSEQEMSNTSCSSSIKADSVHLQMPPRTYQPNDEVMLMTGKDGPALFLPFKAFRIDASRLKTDDEDAGWEYNLKYLNHEGRFMDGQYFFQKFLMPAGPPPPFPPEDA